MAALSIRNLDGAVVERLRMRAAGNGRSMESEARAILTSAVSAEAEGGLFGALIDRFSELGGVDLELPERNTPPRAARLK